MRSRRLLREVLLPVALGLLGIAVLLPGAAPAQEEVTSAIRRYKDREASTGYYEEYEVKPRRQRPLVGVPEVQRRTSPYATYKPRMRQKRESVPAWRTPTPALSSMNSGAARTAMSEQAKHSHTTRGNITCRQCHGGEPIAGINYYYSPLNPIRRHAYVCAKCHEGAGASFATFLIHEPQAGAAQTRKTLPVPLLRQLVHVPPHRGDPGLLHPAYRGVGNQRIFGDFAQETQGSRQPEAEEESGDA